MAARRFRSTGTRSRGHCSAAYNHRPRCHSVANARTGGQCDGTGKRLAGEFLSADEFAARDLARPDAARGGFPLQPGRLRAPGGPDRRPAFRARGLAAGSPARQPAHRAAAPRGRERRAPAGVSRRGTRARAGGTAGLLPGQRPRCSREKLDAAAPAGALPSVCRPAVPPGPDPRGAAGLVLVHAVPPPDRRRLDLRCADPLAGRDLHRAGRRPGSRSPGTVVRRVRREGCGVHTLAAVRQAPRLLAGQVRGTPTADFRAFARGIGGRRRHAHALPFAGAAARDERTHRRVRAGARIDRLPGDSGRDVRAVRAHGASGRPQHRARRAEPLQRGLQGDRRPVLGREPGASVVRHGPELCRPAHQNRPHAQAGLPRPAFSGRRDQPGAGAAQRRPRAAVRPEHLVHAPGPRRALRRRDGRAHRCGDAAAAVTPESVRLPLRQRGRDRSRNRVHLQHGVPGRARRASPVAAVAAHARPPAGRAAGAGECLPAGERGRAPATRAMECDRRRLAAQPVRARAVRDFCRLQPGCGGAGLRGRVFALRGAQRRGQPHRPLPARPGRRAGDARGAVRGAGPPAHRQRAGHPEGGRRLRAAGPGLSARAARVPAGRQRRHGSTGRCRRPRRAGRHFRALRRAGRRGPALERPLHRQPAARSSGAGRREPSLCDLHLGFHRHAQRRDGGAPQPVRVHHGAAAGLPAPRTLPAAVVDLLRQLGGRHLRHAGLGRRAAAAPARGRSVAAGAARRHPFLAGDQPAVRAVAAAGLDRRGRWRRARHAASGDRRRRGLLAGAGRARGRAAAARVALQRVRPDGGHRVGDRPPLRCVRRPVVRADRAADCQLRRSPAGPNGPSGADRRNRRDLHWRRRRRARLPEPARTHGRAFPARSLRRGGRRAHVPHRGPGTPPAGRQHRIPGPQRLAGEDPRLPHRAGRDRGAAAGMPRRARGGGAGAGRQPGRPAAGSVRRRGRRRPFRTRPARALGPAAARLHGARAVREPRFHAVDGQRQARPQSAAGAGDRRHGRRRPAARR